MTKPKKEVKQVEGFQKCACGKQETIGNADCEIGGVCHRVNNPCYVMTTSLTEFLEGERKEFDSLFQKTSINRPNFTATYTEILDWIEAHDQRVLAFVREMVKKVSFGAGLSNDGNDPAYNNGYYGGVEDTKKELLSLLTPPTKV